MMGGPCFVPAAADFVVHHFLERPALGNPSSWKLQVIHDCLGLNMTGAGEAHLLDASAQLVALFGEAVATLRGRA